MIVETLIERFSERESTEFASIHTFFEFETCTFFPLHDEMTLKIIDALVTITEELNSALAGLDNVFPSWEYPDPWLGCSPQEFEASLLKGLMLRQAFNLLSKGLWERINKEVDIPDDVKARICMTNDLQVVVAWKKPDGVAV